MCSRVRAYERMCVHVRSHASARRHVHRNKEARGTAGKVGIGPHAKEGLCRKPHPGWAALVLKLLDAHPGRAALVLKLLDALVIVLVTRRSREGQLRGICRSPAWPGPPGKQLPVEGHVLSPRT